MIRALIVLFNDDVTEEEAEDVSFDLEIFLHDENYREATVEHFTERRAKELIRKGAS